MAQATEERVYLGQFGPQMDRRGYHKKNDDVLDLRGDLGIELALLDRHLERQWPPALIRHADHIRQSFDLSHEAAFDARLAIPHPVSLRDLAQRQRRNARA